MKIRTGAMALSVSLILSGCAAMSVKGLQKREPVLVADSQRDSNAIIACVSAAWLNFGGATPKTVQRENGTMLVLGDAFPMLLVDATRTASGTHLVMHMFKTLHKGGDRQRVEEVRACL